MTYLLYTKRLNLDHLGCVLENVRVSDCDELVWFIDIPLFNNNATLCIDVARKGICQILCRVLA